MRNTAKLPGRAAPKERPNGDEIHDFVISTGGGIGADNDSEMFKLESQDGARVNQVAPHNDIPNTNAISCGSFELGGETGLVSFVCASFVYIHKRTHA